MEKHYKKQIHSPPLCKDTLDYSRDLSSEQASSLVCEASLLNKLEVVAYPYTTKGNSLYNRMTVNIKFFLT